MKVAKRMLMVTILGLVAIEMFGCDSDKSVQVQGKSKKARHVQAVAVKRERLVEFLETTGDVVAVNTVTMQATTERNSGKPTEHWQARGSPLISSRDLEVQTLSF